MAQSQKVESLLKPKVTPTLGLLGATVNAMALIAPGAFLWLTYQLQAAATVPSGASCATDIWSGIIVALSVCFLTALSYSQLAKIYPDLFLYFNTVDFKTTTHFVTPFLAGLSFDVARGLSRVVPHQKWPQPFGNLILMVLTRGPAQRPASR